MLSVMGFIFQNGFHAVVKDTAAILFSMGRFQRLDSELLIGFNKPTSEDVEKVRWIFFSSHNKACLTG